MISTNSIQLSSDSEIEDANGMNVEKRPHPCLETVVINGVNSRKKACQKFGRHPARYELEHGISPNIFTPTENNLCYTNQGSTQVAKSSPCQLPSSWAAPICRQFWKAGNYGNEQSAKISIKSTFTNFHIFQYAFIPFLFICIHACMALMIFDLTWGSPVTNS